MSFKEKISLKDSIEFIVDNRGKTVPTAETGIALIATNCINNSSLYPEFKNVRYISEDTFNNWFRAHPKPNDIIFTLKGSQNGAACLVPEVVNFAIAQDMVALRVNKKIMDPYFLLAALRSKEVQYSIKSLDVSDVIPHLKKGDFDKLLLPFPKLDVQKSIGEIFITLEKKIELNRQMNQTLESMAQGLFKSWFVDFDPVMDNAMASNQEIPDELQAMAEKRQLVPDSKKLIFTNPELAAKFPSSFVFNETLGKWIPEGWEVKILSDLIKIIGGGTPKTSNDEYWNGTIPWFSVVDAPNDSDVFVIDTEKKVSNEGVKNSSTQILREGTTIISARGTVGKCAIVGVAMAMNQSCYGIQNLNENEDIFTYLLVRQNVSDLQNKSHGSVFSTITRDTFSAIQIVVPLTGKVINVFESSLKYNFEKIKSNLFENQTLVNLRDRLLPELISGRVRVKDIMIN